MEVEKRKVTNRIDSVVENRDPLELYELLKEYANFPATLKDVFEYLILLKQECEWLRGPFQKPLESIWTECYLRKYPVEIPAIYEYHHFSQKPPKAGGEEESYGVIDMVLGINYSNSKGFSGSSSVRDFFSNERGTIHRYLYSGKGIFLWEGKDYKKWRMFHFKMRLIAFHFLYWLSEMISLENKRLLVEYGENLIDREGGIKFGGNEEKIAFFLTNLPPLVNGIDAREKLKEILRQVNLLYSENDWDLFVLTYQREVMKRWMSDESQRMNDIFRERCLTTL